MNRQTQGNMDNDRQKEEMINKAAKHVGKSPEQLKSAMEKLTPQQKEQLNKALSDEQYAKKLLSTPQAQALIKMLMGGK